MDLFWAILIIAAVTILLFAIIPSLLESPDASGQGARSHAAWRQQQQAASHPPFAPASRRDDAVDRAMLEAHYAPARDDIPEDYPRKKIGACPYTKAPSTDLPLSDIPLCLAQSSESMKLDLRRCGDKK